jgi:hypothetical protein
MSFANLPQLTKLLRPHSLAHSVGFSWEVIASNLGYIISNMISHFLSVFEEIWISEENLFSFNVNVNTNIVESRKKGYAEKNMMESIL